MSNKFLEKLKKEKEENVMKVFCDIRECLADIREIVYRNGGLYDREIGERIENYAHKKK